MSKFQRLLAIIKWQYLASESGRGHQKPPCLLLKSLNMDYAESNEVLLWQNQDVCLIGNLKHREHITASHPANDLGKTNAFATLIGWKESRTFFDSEERSSTKES